MTYILRGIEAEALTELTDKQRKTVLRLLARVSEASYRRGAQQGRHLTLERPDAMPHDLAAWRFNVSLDSSPWLDQRKSEPAAERLDCEYGQSLREVGLTP